ncbi:enoyl-CoA hydratase [Gordonia sp. TBRC 11910]|uniref:Enoyl-CoA hydratase n=1 Tax=Gordonia asplenii TaxID=2725283 RepID=A0A848KW81_9ACTN|nr:enoyl-CoA hydratase [Gordonia asplenii]NMO02926.1 enoyl-CoA hydratase [Gordonia asplenii]
MSDTVLLERRGPLGLITLNRPDRLNAVNPELLDAMLGVLEAVADDEAVRVVVVTGAGKAFCAGGDLAGIANRAACDTGANSRISVLRKRMRTTQLLHEMPKPTIAMINGACAGAGLAWACAADLRYCADSAKFNTAFLTAGLSGDFGGSWTLPRIVGPARARELYLLPGRFDAAEALRIGLVNGTVPAAELEATVLSVAERLAASAPRALRGIKANLNDSLHLSLSDQLDREAQRHVHCQAGNDTAEAAAAFIEKRVPVFTDR